MTPVILPPSAGTSTPTVTAAAHSSMLATVPDAPPAAARLDVGSVVKGTVLGRDAQGFVNIRTDKGVLALQTNANLPVGSQVTLEVRVAGSRLQLVVLSIELPAGQTPAASTVPPPSTPSGTAQGGAAQGGVPPASLPPAGAPPPTAPSVALAVALTGGGLVMATVVHANHAGIAGQPAGLPAGQRPAQPGVATPALPGQAAAGQAGPAPVGPGPAASGAVPPTPTAASGALSNAVPVTGTSASNTLAGRVPATLPTGTQPTPPTLPGTPGAGAQTTHAAGQTGSSAAPSGVTSPQIANLAAGAAGVPGGIAAQALAAGAATATSPLPPGTEMGVRILAAALPGAPAPMPGAGPTVPPSGTTVQIPGTVVAHTPNRQPIVDTPLGPMVVAVKGALPAGSTLLIEIPPQPRIADAMLGPVVTSAQQALLRLFRGWPALGSTLAAFGAANDGASAQALAAKLPHTGPGLASGLLSLIAQFAAGETPELLGPALREALEKIGKRDLADRLNGEFRQIGRLAGEPSGGDWRVMFLPLRHEGELHQVNMYLRGKRKNGERDGPDTGTRFVVEVDMTRLGPIQLDGLVHGRRFDLMLRSRMQLAPTIRRDIERIFDEARGIGGFAGTIGFQVAASFPVQPLDQAKRKEALGGVVV